MNGLAHVDCGLGTVVMNVWFEKFLKFCQDAKFCPFVAQNHCPKHHSTHSHACKPCRSIVWMHGEMIEWSGSCGLGIVVMSVWFEKFLKFCQDAKFCPFLAQNHCPKHHSTHSHACKPCKSIVWVHGEMIEWSGSCGLGIVVMGVCLKSFWCSAQMQKFAHLWPKNTVQKYHSTHSHVSKPCKSIVWMHGEMIEWWSGSCELGNVVMGVCLKSF